MSAESKSSQPRRQEVTGYQTFLARRVERELGSPKFRDLANWFSGRMQALPDMYTEPTPLTGKGGWSYEATPDGTQVDKIVSGFFEFKGDLVHTGKQKDDGTEVTWNQGGIHQAESSVTLPTPEGDFGMDASGFVGMIQDDKGNMLLSVGQEPYAKSPKRALARTPFQTSAKKLQGLLEGNKDLDPGLARTMDIIGQGRTPQQLFKDGTFNAFPLAAADANRIAATNIGFVHTVKDEKIKKALESDGANRWCTPDEVSALIRAGLVNGHTIAAAAGINDFKPRERAAA